MLFRKRLLCSEISLLLSAGLALTTVPESAHAQLPVYTCRPNTAGDGWICDSTGPTTSGNTADETNRYNSDNAVLRQAPQAEVQPPPGAPESRTEDEADPVTVPDQLPREQESTALQPGITEPVIDPLEIVVPVSDHELDWIPRESLTAEQLQAVPRNCCGAFIDPSVGVSDNDADPATAETLLRFNTGLEQPSQNLINIDGDVVVQQGYRTVVNDDTTRIDRETNTILMNGNVEFREPGLLLLGTSAFIDRDNNANSITSAQYVLHDYGAHGQAESIIYNSDSGVVSIENGEFSRCDPGSNFWKLEADAITLNQTENRGYASNVKLRLGDVPIFYYPFTLPFPLGDESVSGFLAPSTGSTRSGGFDFELPYYFKLAPHYDATLSPRHISDRGTMVGIEARYLASWSMNTLNLSSLSGDNLFDPATVNIPGSDSPPREDRWFIGYEHSGRIGRNFTTFVDYNSVSDDDYFYDLGSNGLNLTSRTHLNRRGALNFYSEYLRAGVNVQRIQVIDPFISAASLSLPYDRLPQFHFESDTYLAAGFRVGIRGEITSFDRNLDKARLSATQLANGALANGERINLEPEINWSLENPGWFLRSTAKYKHTEYRLEDQAIGTSDDPDVGVGIYSVDGGLVFEREMSRG
ncbi:MAG TPA: hypothetical protein DCM64_00715, partial [Gammaproteobacteria bacterium]|nr:hypothetical protein [Gammaproteobacteria bacterium]